MNRFDSTFFRLFYIKYREYMVPSCVVVVCMIVFVFIIPPQVKNIFVNKQDSEEVKKRIETLSSNIALLSSLNDSALDENLSVSSSALPPEKDFETIFQAISDTASITGVSVDDYGLDIGDAAQGVAQADRPPQLALNLALRGGGVSGTNRFIALLQKKFPLSEVTSANITGDSSSIAIVFFFKPYPQIQGNVNLALKQLNKNEVSTLDTLLQWKNESFSPAPTVATSSSTLP